MSVEQLETVVAIAEEGALMRAARRLHISQPPLTRRLSALEDELGTRLFERTPRGMHPTPAGRDFVVRARHILAAISAARDAMAHHHVRGPDAAAPDERPAGNQRHE